MVSTWLAEELEKINHGIRDKYVQVAKTPEGHFTYPTGRRGLEGLGYDAGPIAGLPEEVAAAYCGVGNPFAAAPIAAGDHVLDIGCGAGVDSLLAARAAGPSGKVMGADLTAEMIGRAIANQKIAGVENASFIVGRVQDLSGLDGTFDVVISNGVFNLIPEKEEALAAVFRLLKPGGRLAIADQFATAPGAKSISERVQSWFR